MEMKNTASYHTSSIISHFLCDVILMLKETTPTHSIGIFGENAGPMLSICPQAMHENAIRTTPW
jgi:hypothetical protein